MIIVYASKTGFTKKYARMLSEKLGMDKMMLSMFVKALKKNAEKDEQQKEAVEIILHGFDGVREENLTPVLEWINRKFSLTDKIS